MSQKSIQLMLGINVSGVTRMSFDPENSAYVVGRVLLLVVFALLADGSAQTSIKPPPVPERLVADLKNDDPLVRRSAANQIGAMRAREAVRVLKRTLTDKDSTVREAAAFALGQIADQKAGDALERALKDKVAAVRASAAFSLGLLGNHKDIDALSEALDDEDAAVRSSAVAALGLLQDDAGADEIVDMLNDPAFDVRYDAVWALGRLDAPDAAGHIHALLLNLDAASVDEASREAFRQAAQNSLERLRQRAGVPVASEPRPRRASPGVVRPGGEASDSESSAASLSQTRYVALRQRVQAAPTERALSNRVTGIVSLRVLVDATGRAARAYVTKRLGFGLDQRAIQAVLQYRFEPAMESGLPQTSWMFIEVKF